MAVVKEGEEGKNKIRSARIHEKVKGK